MSKRRSAFIGFSAIGLSAALTGCEQPARTAPGAVEEAVYTSADACRRDNPGVDCDAVMKQAAEEHARTAPAFQSKQACEADWGENSCTERPQSHGSSFMPIMMGFMLGRALSGGGYGHPIYGGAPGIFSGGQRIGDADRVNGRYAPPPRATVVEGPGGRVSAGRVTRGGFGRSGMGLGGRGG